MTISLKDYAEAANTLKEAYIIANKAFQASSDEDCIIAYNVMLSIDELIEYLKISIKA